MKKLLLLLSLLPLSLMAAEPEVKSVKLIWNANSEADLAGYRLYQGVSSNSYNKVFVITGNVPTFTVVPSDSDLVVGQTYYWVVTAFNTAGLESEPSNQVSYTVPSPEQPVDRPSAPTGNKVSEVVYEQVRVDTTTNRVTVRFP